MPTAPIPFVPHVEGAFDALAGGSPSALNVVMDSKGTVRRRPAIAHYSESPEGAVDSGGVAGLYCTAAGKLFAVGSSGAERRIYRVGSGGAVRLGSDSAPYGLRGTGRPVFAETELLLVVAGGRQLEKIQLSMDAPSRLGGTCPKATHVVANASRLLANDTEEYPSWVRFSDIATGTLVYDGHESWTEGLGDAGHITTEARPDRVVAVADGTNEVLVFGATTVQTYAPDPSLVYALTSVAEYGCAAPYSPVRFEGQFAWLDDRRRFVIGDGRSVNPISEAIQPELDSLQRVDDCWGCRVLTARVDALVFTFPEEQRSFVFQKGAGWGSWTGAHGRGVWPVTAHTLRSDTHTNVVGLSDGRVARLVEGGADDLGEPIVAQVTTGFLERDTRNWKHCEALRLVLRRDGAASGAVVQVQWRDEPGDPWGPPLDVEMDASSPPGRASVVDFRGMGTYRQRQWRFTFAGPDDLTLVSAQETYRVLDF